LLDRHASRGAAFGDVDNDGTVEVLVNHQNETPGPLKLQNPPTHSWVGLKLIGRNSNSTAIGATVKLIAGGRSQQDEFEVAEVICLKTTCVCTLA